MSGSYGDIDLSEQDDGEDLQKIIETVPEQPMNYESQAQKLNNHVETHRNITLE